MSFHTIYLCLGSSSASNILSPFFNIVNRNSSFKILCPLLGGSEVKASACDVGDLSSIPGSEDPLEKEMATHSSILTWRIPRTEEPGGYSPWGCIELDTLKWLSTYTQWKRGCVYFVLFTVTGFKDRDIFEVCSVMQAWFVCCGELVKIDMPGLYVWLAET